VGRSPYADIVIADPSVAEYHAEIVVADDGRIFVCDCGTSAGTWLRVSDGARSRWEPLRQAFARREDVLRLGDHERLVSDILPAADPPQVRSADDAGRRELVRSGGRLSRDPMTGEIVRRRG
jgi:pSer/pThr/pTyr-binding forkhead associated (FHA) protein